MRACRANMAVAAAVGLAVAVSAPAGPRDEVTASWSAEYERTAEAIRLRATDPEKAARLQEHLLDARAGILPGDRDPLDVALRRTGALLADVRALEGAPDLSAPGGALATLRARAAALEPSAGAARRARRELYFEVRAVGRRIALANPLLAFDEIFVTTGNPTGWHIQSHFYGKKASRNELLALSGWREGKLRVRRLLEGVKVSAGRYAGETLTGGRVGTMDLSFDGRYLLFDYSACRRPKDFGEDTVFNPSHMNPDMSYNIWKLDLKTKRLVPLTDTMYNDSCPAWLPDGRIVFTSDRRGAYVRCHPWGPPKRRYDRRGHHQPCATLHTMKADGSDVVPISWHETSETFPRVTNNGAIVYTRWDYVDREFHAGHHIWFCAPDGRDPRGPHGNYPMPHDMMAPLDGEGGPGPKWRDGRKDRPWAEYCIRPIPGSNRYVAVASTHHHAPEGKLIFIDPGVPDNAGMAQVRKARPGKLPHEGRDSVDRDPEFFPHAWPWPLSEDYWLLADTLGNALVLMDRFGNRDVIWAGEACFVLPRTPRPRPPIIPTRTFQGERAARPHPPATVAVMNVYEADFDWPAGTKIEALRIVQIFSRPWSSPFNNVGESYMTGTTNRMSLGTVPVEDDGSAYFLAPVACEIYFQALDGDGLAVQSMRSGTYVHPGEQLTCVGCHEDKWASNRTLPPRKALQRPPSPMTPDAGGLEPVNYYRLVKPVLDRKCLPCHRENKAGPRTSSYEKLEPYAFYFHGAGGGHQRDHGGYRAIAGKVGARHSRMGRALMGRRHRRYLAEGKLTEEDVRRVCLWLDLNSLQYGSSSIDPDDQARQRAGEIVWPKLEFDIDNPQRLDRPPAGAAAE